MMVHSDWACDWLARMQDLYLKIGDSETSFFFWRAPDSQTPVCNTKISRLGKVICPDTSVLKDHSIPPTCTLSKCPKIFFELQNMLKKTLQIYMYLHT